jgi:processive 1,2-diacylglycerol beta-glucosyltransferase
VTALLINSPRLQQMSESAREWHVDGAANIVNSLIEILDATKQEELVQAEEVVG